MTARDEVVDALAAVVPAGIKVLPYSRSLEQPERATAMVRSDAVRPSPNPKAWRVYEFAVIVVVPQQDPHGGADDALDAALDDVLYAIDNAPSLLWTVATRAVFEDAYPCYEITLTIPAILKEQ